MDGNNKIGGLNTAKNYFILSSDAEFDEWGQKFKKCAKTAVTAKKGSKAYLDRVESFRKALAHTTVKTVPLSTKPSPAKQPSEEKHQMQQIGPQPKKSVADYQEDTRAIQEKNKEVERMKAEEELRIAEKRRHTTAPDAHQPFGEEK